MLTYLERAKLTTNQTAEKLFTLLETKQTNLAVSADVTTSAQLLNLIEQVGDQIAVLKTHIDIIADFTPALPEQLQALAKKFNFLIFEDRKFADIGNTVQHQYQGGIYHIADWANITNAHTLPGPGIIEGLQEIGLPLGRGLLLLAEMSSKGSLATGAYTDATVALANQHPDFVIGFIAQGKLTNNPAHIAMTPGVQFAATTDALGQQYNTPEYIINEKKSDIIIVGRGIYAAKNPGQEAARYRTAGWEAYQKRLTQS